MQIFLLLRVNSFLKQHKNYNLGRRPKGAVAR
nr:MAG TPA: hypothetical protein [Caudoviricetes sp.]